MRIFNLFKKETDSDQLEISDAFELSKLFWPTFSVVEDAVFLEWEKVSDLEKAYGGGMNRTQLESFSNHTHILDRFDHKASLGKEPWWNNRHPDFKLACNLGKKVARLWTVKLSLDFPNEEFLVYYTEEDNPIVRFHKVREGEDLWLDPKQYEKEILEEKIMIWNSKKMSHNQSRLA